MAVNSQTDVRYIISNQAGQIIYMSKDKNFTTGIQSITINTHQLPHPGQYIINFVFDNKYYITRKIQIR
jgi:hypothetical protein